MENNNILVCILSDFCDPPTMRGSGVFIEKDIVLTCYHVIQRKKNLQVYIKYPDKTLILPATILMSSKGYDFALLKVEGGPYAHTSLLTTPLAPDSEVDIQSLYDPKHSGKGIVKYTSCISEDKLEEVSYLVVGPLSQPGMSGCPAIYDGKVAGIAAFVGVSKHNKRKTQVVPSHIICAKIMEKHNGVLGSGS